VGWEDTRFGLTHNPHCPRFSHHYCVIPDLRSSCRGTMQPMPMDTRDLVPIGIGPNSGMTHQFRLIERDRYSLSVLSVWSVVIHVDTRVKPAHDGPLYRRHPRT